MTTEEVRNKILQTKSPDWFNKVTIRFFNTKSEFSMPLVGFSAIYEYAEQQVKGWESKGESLPQVFETVKKRMTNLKQNMLGILQNGISVDINNLQAQWQNQINVNFNGEYIAYEQPEVDFLIGLSKSYPKYFQSAYEFIFGKVELSSQLAGKNDFIGTLMAYEFLTKYSSEILSRKNSEGSAVYNIKKDFATYLSNSEQQILEFLKNSNEQKTKDLNLISELIAEKTILFNNWHQNSKTEFENFNKESSSKIIDLEKTYEELLRLKKPAEYWKERGEQLKDEGNKARNWLIGMILIGAILLYVLLWWTPEGMLTSFFGNDKGSALRWSIIFVTFISLIFLGIRYVSKLMFSSYHLSRDAEERYRLTHVYLALIKEASIDKAERQLIMQSLFSRADTGLLKEDSSPTMPSGIDRIIKP